jgi:LmbE family N-acetylglucosaminyl deacetylase
MERRAGLRLTRYRSERRSRRLRWRTVLSWFAVSFLLTLGAGAAVPTSSWAASPGTILIVAPHPDDDLLFGAGVAASALMAGKTVKIVYMTNGDKYYGISQGLARQDEAVLGQSIIRASDPNLFESDLIFLGYPDGYLLNILQNYPDITDSFVNPVFGQATTYGTRGLGSSDYHTFLFNSSALYNGANISVDLENIIESYRPSDVYTTDEFDTHNDHKATYYFVRAALRRVKSTDTMYAPILHKTIVQWNSWPLPIDPQTDFSEIPGLSLTDLVWNERETIPVPTVMQSLDLNSNPKYLAIDAHRSQGGASGYLGEFIHRDEIFWQDDLANHAPTAEAGPGQSVASSAPVTLDGSGSSDPDGDPLTYQWTQTGGPSVSLSSALAATPSFTAPTGPASLTFSLVVSDGEATSLADSVTITVQAANHAPTAEAGPGQSVASSAPVTLDGSGSSDPDGDPLTYQWTQTGGPSVSLSSALAATPSFTAPTGPASLTFSLVVSDGEATSLADSVTITVQAAKRYEQTDSHLTYVGTWTTRSTTLCSDGSCKITSVSGASVTIVFIGTRLDWIAMKGSNCGIARVTLDTTGPVLVDLYNSATLYKQKVWSTGTLANGSHTVKIEFTATKRSRASSTAINLDAVDVMGVLTETSVPPLVNAGPDASVALRTWGGVFAQTGSFTDPDSDAWTATVDWGDGTSEQTLVLSTYKSFTLNHIFRKKGTYTITIRVMDNTGGMGTDTVIVRVT